MNTDFNYCRLELLFNPICHLARWLNFAIFAGIWPRETRFVMWDIQTWSIVFCIHVLLNGIAKKNLIATVCWDVTYYRESATKHSTTMYSSWWSNRGPTPNHHYHINVKHITYFLYSNYCYHAIMSIRHLYSLEWQQQFMKKPICTNSAWHSNENHRIVCIVYNSSQYNIACGSGAASQINKVFLIYRNMCTILVQ